MMKELGFGKGYAYDHDEADGFSGADYWPEGMTAETFYRPTPRGQEARIGERLAEWARRREERRRAGRE
jgi:putative ATPase